MKYAWLTIVPACDPDTYLNEHRPMPGTQVFLSADTYPGINYQAAERIAAIGGRVDSGVSTEGCILDGRTGEYTRLDWRIYPCTVNGDNLNHG